MRREKVTDNAHTNTESSWLRRTQSSQPNRNAIDAFRARETYAMFHFESMPDEILVKILTKFHGAMDPKTRPALKMLRTIGSVSRRMRRLCFESVFWEGADSLICFKNAENTRQILSHLSDTNTITSVKLTSTVIHLTAKFHAPVLSKSLLERGYKDSLECLVHVLNRCPSICTLSVALSHGTSPFQFLGALPHTSLTALNIQSCANGHLSPITCFEAFSVIKVCPNLTHISFQVGADYYPKQGRWAVAIDFKNLATYCPGLKEVSLTNMGPYHSFYSLFSLERLNSLPSFTSLKLKFFNITNYRTLADLTNVHEIHVENHFSDVSLMKENRQSIHFVNCNLRCFTMLRHTGYCIEGFSFVRCHNLHTVSIDVPCEGLVGVKVNIEDCENLETLDTGDIPPRFVTINGRCRRR
mmetsp:Transcript_25618/g.42129  ORF Transcript_25618/g.42129 Transcript_25618/m.42129 type:complete len:413 (-) Transcript_25618:176-1414(-)